MTNFHRQTLDGGCRQGERENKRSVTVAGNDLRGNRLNGKSENFGDIRLHFGREMRKCADRSRNGATRDFGDGGSQTVMRAQKFAAVSEEFESEGCDFRVHPVRATDGKSVAMFARADENRLGDFFDSFQYMFTRLAQQQRVGSVNSVIRCYSKVEPARIVSEGFANRVEEREDIVMKNGVKFFNTRTIRRGAARNGVGGGLRDDSMPRACDGDRLFHLKPGG